MQQVKERLKGSAFVIAVFVVMVILPPIGTKIVIATCFALAMFEVIVAMDGLTSHIWLIERFGLEYGYWWLRKWFILDERLITPVTQTLVLATAILLTLGDVDLVCLNKSELLFVVITIALADAGGYLAGYFFGQHRVQYLADISSKKTWEGYLGMVMVGWTVGFVLIEIGLVPDTYGARIFAIFSGFFAAAGDLLGSLCKRSLSIDDSGSVLLGYPVLGFAERLLAGHGGALDRMDSIAFAVLVYGATLIAV